MQVAVPEATSAFAAARRALHAGCAHRPANPPARFVEAGDNHWHGAAPDRLLAHFAMQHNDDKRVPVSWGST